MCEEISPCDVHSGCKEGDLCCMHFTGGVLRSDVCMKCTSVTCNFEPVEFIGMGI